MNKIKTYFGVQSIVENHINLCILKKAKKHFFWQYFPHFPSHGIYGCTNRTSWRDTVDEIAWNSFVFSNYFIFAWRISDGKRKLLFKNDDLLIFNRWSDCHNSVAAHFVKHWTDTAATPTKTNFFRHDSRKRKISCRKGAALSLCFQW